MDKAVELVLQGFAKLTAAQKTEVVKHIEQYKIHGILNESVRKTYVQMGPLEKGCPCCGR